MNKELEELKQIRHDFYINGKVDYDSISYFTNIERALEAFDIIKEMFLDGNDVTKVLLSIYQSKDFEEFQQTHAFANRQKYELLKEVLK